MAMTVRELIVLLQACDQSQVVLAQDGTFGPYEIASAKQHSFHTVYDDCSLAWGGRCSRCDKGEPFAVPCVVVGGDD
jgi:hypothetical protein